MCFTVVRDLKDCKRLIADEMITCLSLSLFVFVVTLCRPGFPGRSSVKKGKERRGDEKRRRG